MQADTATAPAIQLYCGGGAGTYNGEPDDLVGHRCYTAAWPANKNIWPRLALDQCAVLLDSGAFTDKPRARLDAPAALARQLQWEADAGARTGHPDWRARALVSYDVLIDETWTGDVRTKRRWSVREADWAVDATVEAAAYLASQRAALAPRTLVLSAQGVDAAQYAACVARILPATRPGDWLGLGGWCILGRYTSYLPTFWQALHATLPQVAASGIRHVHIFGVLYRHALGGLLWLADEHGLSVSTDSNAPVLNALCRNIKKSGARFPDWRRNVQWWQDTLAHLRESPYYRRPPCPPRTQQLALFDLA